MTKKDFIKKLEQFPDDMEIVITDGWDARCYHGNFEFQLCEESDENNTKFIDIGIGGHRFGNKLPFA